MRQQELPAVFFMQKIPRMVKGEEKWFLSSSVIKSGIRKKLTTFSYRKESLIICG